MFADVVAAAIGRLPQCRHHHYLWARQRGAPSCIQARGGRTNGCHAQPPMRRRSCHPRCRALASSFQPSKSSVLHRRPLRHSGVHSHRSFRGAFTPGPAAAPRHRCRPQPHLPHRRIQSHRRKDGSLHVRVGSCDRWQDREGLGLAGVWEVLPLQLPSLDVDVRRVPLPPAAQAYLAGATFALAASPCSTPVLATLLAYVSQTRNPLQGGSLLLACTCGYVGPLLLAASATGAVKQLLALRQYSAWVTPASGVLLVAGGTYTLLLRLVPS